MRGLHGHLRLVCARDERGCSHLREQSFRAPMHLSKPHEDAGVLVVNIVNPTAGLLAGDEIRCDVAVEAEASLLLTTPSASRAHQMRGGCAVVRQKFHVAPGGFLDIWPELFIPQAGARYHQFTSVGVESGGELILAEMLAPGRAASGEVFLYESLRWETDLVVDEALVARERYSLMPGTPSVEALREVFPTAYYGSVYVVSAQSTSMEACSRDLHDLHSESAWVGVSALRGGRASVVKVVAENAIGLRATMGKVRRLIYTALGRAEPDLRRTVPIG